MSTTQQADGEIHEGQLLNFLVKRLDEEVPLPLANNAEITAENLCLCALCFELERPRCKHGLYHLRTNFEPERIKRVANTLLRRDLVELLPEQLEVCADLHLRPYYGDEDDTENLYHWKPSVEPPRSTPKRRSTRV